MKSSTAAFVPIVAAWVAAGPLVARAAVPREETWRADVSVQGDTRTQAVATDGAGNAYVAGVAANGVTYTRFLQKLNGAGAQLWRFVSASSPYEITDQQMVVDEAGGALYVVRSSMVDASTRIVSVARHSLGTGASIWEASAGADRVPDARTRTAGMGLGAGGVVWVACQSQASFPGDGLRWSIRYRKLNAATGASLEDGTLAGSASTDRYLFDLAAAGDRLFVAYREQGPTDFDLVVIGFDIGAGSLVVLNPHEPTPCSATAPCRQEFHLGIPTSTSGTATFTDGVLDANQNFALAGYYEEFEPEDCSPQCFGDRYWYYPVVVKVDRANHVLFQTIEQGSSGARFTSGNSRSDDVTARVTAGAGGSVFVLVAGEPFGSRLVEVAANGVRGDSRGADTYISERFSGGGCSQWSPVWQPRALAAAFPGGFVMTGQLPAYCSSSGFPIDLDTARTAWFTPTVPALYDSDQRLPTCHGVATTCDSDNLLVGREAIPGGAEPNQPNTLRATCADGDRGTFHSDESIDRIRVFTREGGPLQQGRTAYIEVTVWAYSVYSNDRLDLFYRSNTLASGWTYLTTLAPTGPGLQTLGTSYTLPPGNHQAVRAQFRWGGTNAVCDPGMFTDRDDLAFMVADAARIDSALGAPRCSRVASACDSGMLLHGRDTIAGDAEPNQPNTLGGTCPDGTSASPTEGSVDRIRVWQWNAGNPAPGRTTFVEVEARIASTDDRLDLYYTGNAASPVWTYLATVVPAHTGSQILSKAYALPAGTLQAVRASLRRAGSLSNCPAGSFNDRDDLVFAVGQ